ncbi:hypothetical protein C8J57DRAFT_1435196 [Mycena rebaudengoi]|nr:hypothetical protein C8J57DRAFT_1435196 [Mycena rebaudengoi]
MDALGINLPIFLHALSWGDASCITDAKIRYARSSLMVSKELPGILKRWLSPPRSATSHHARAKGAKSVMESFAKDCMQTSIECELEAIAPILSSPVGNDVDEEELTGTSFVDLIEVIQDRAPHTWGLVRRMAFSRTQEQRNTRKVPVTIVFSVISILSYSRSHHRNRIQKLFAIYFKFRGLSAKGFDTLHALGLTMSNRWTGIAVGKISKKSMEIVLALMKIYPWLLSYDNATVSFRVFSQRLDNKGDFGNGTACTVYIKRSAVPLSSTANRDLQIKRAEGQKTPITLLEIWDLATAAAPRLAVHTSFHVLKVLLDAPDFDFPSYNSRDSTLLSKPPRTRGLPFGPDHVMLQYLLGTVGIPEVSYEDNERLVDEWLRQLKLDSPEVQKKLGTETVQAWVGDQLTVDRLRNIFHFRAEDDNSFDRLDWMLNPPGWLHIMMCFANSLHKQHLGTSKGRGLSAAFDVLQRKGLGVSHIQGPFYHHIDEALHHILEAHIREEWLETTGVKELSELRTKTPAELVALAAKVRKEHGSSYALNLMDARDGPSGKLDEVKYQSVMFTRDVLQICSPDLLFRFAGGKNSNYTGEILELLQGLNKEWPPEIGANLSGNFIRDNCWVLNEQPKPDTFLPVDMAQEHNIKDIKVTYRSQGPNVDWKFLKKLHPAIHVIKLVGKYMESEFGTANRGNKHTPPKKELDVTEMQKWQRDSKSNKTIQARKAGSKRDKIKNYIGNGQNNLQTSNRMQRWAENRSYPRATTENWEEDSSDSAASEDDV